MASLDIHLFGKLRCQANGQPLDALAARKVQELFCYLLLYRQRPHARETLAALLWGEHSTVQSKTYLRRTLWQLQQALDSQLGLVCQPVLLVDAEWVQVNNQADLWLDVDVLERAWARVQGLPGAQLTSHQAHALHEAVALYHAELLEGWYHDWCLLERERLQQIYVGMLDKLMDYCERHQTYDAGLGYGASILHYDRARECTHQRLMRLHYLMGDRTGALRQYEHCVTALQEELGVGPTEATTALYEQIRLNELAAPPVVPTSANPDAAVAVLGRLKHIQRALQDMQQQVVQEIQVLEGALNSNPVEGGRGPDHAAAPGARASHSSARAAQPRVSQTSANNRRESPRRTTRRDTLNQRAAT